MNDRLISSDSHFIEPPNLWTDRIDAKFRDRAPRFRSAEQGGEYLACEDVPKRIAPVGNMFAAGKSPEELPRQYEQGWDAAPKSVWDPAARLTEQDVDGVSAEVLYGTLCLILWPIRDLEFLQACFRAFNDYAAEYCSYAPKRLIGIGCVVPDDVPSAVQELSRIAKRGLKGALIPVVPAEGRSYLSDEYDAFWAAAQDLGMVLGMHAGSSRTGTRFFRESIIADYVSAAHPVQRAYTDLVMGGVFERFPRLTIVSVENDVTWLPHLLYRMDHAYEKFRWVQGITLSLQPSEYMKRNTAATFQFEHVETTSKAYGVNNLLWASDYPHRDSTWPHSRERVRDSLAGISSEDAERIASGNAARLYGLE